MDQKSYQATAKSLETLGIKPYQFEGDEDDYMNPRQLDHIKKIIMATRESLLRQLDETKEAWAEEKGQYADEVDQADHESDFAITLRNRDRERRLILKLDKTLTRIENDPDFGYCDRCGDEIGMRRLEARPTAELCINCKAKAEIHERQQKG
nr:RNA polymerase-binding protein DksA [Psittacicella hinzii]